MIDFNVFIEVKGIVPKNFTIPPKEGFYLQLRF